MTCRVCDGREDPYTMGAEKNPLRVYVSQFPAVNLIRAVDLWENGIIISCCVHVLLLNFNKELWDVSIGMRRQAGHDGSRS